jgi:hypothetical protein
MMSLSGNVTHICVDIHDFQSRRRIEEIVCRDIDHVLDELDDPRALAAFASDPSKSPEARLLAGRRVLKRETAVSPRRSNRSGAAEG